MKKFFVFIVMILFALSVSADTTTSKFHKELPKGVFKKTRSGKIIQYDSNGKKIGTYKLNNGKYVKEK